MADKENKEERDVLIGEVITYEEARNVLESGDQSSADKLAKNQDTPPEVLYYLADIGPDGVRAHVAANSATPYQADELLVDDPFDEVRIELARKIGRIIPDLKPGEASQLREHSIKILEKLAQDQLPKVREVIAQAIKSSDQAPKGVIEVLARDTEASVAAPILEYSPLLSDAELKEIVAAGVVGEALAAVARRRQISEDLADAIAGTLEIPAVAALVANKNASIREETLEAIVEQAKKTEELHEPVARRPNLSVRLMKRIAGFVASSLVHAMVDNSEIDDKTASALIREAKKRIEIEDFESDDKADLREKAFDFLNRGMLDDEFILECIAKNRRPLLFNCIAVMANLNDRIVEKVLSSKNGRSITALAWKAGLKMRTALELQQKIGLVPQSKLVLPKDGLHYPFHENDMERDLLFYSG